MGPRGDIGAVITLVRISITSSNPPKWQRDVASGRLIFNLWRFLDRQLHIFNLHNIGCAPQSRKELFKSIANTLKLCQEAPDKRLSFVLGDFNLPAVGGSIANLLNHSLTSKNDSLAPTKAESKRWSKALTGLVELAQPNFICFGGPRIDRIYCSLPPWAMLQAKAAATTLWSTSDKHHRTTSDHCPVAASMNVRQLLPRHLRPIPKWLAVHPVYCKTVQTMLA
jgi:endonuclease/exonuclease/phosphatase family metal-dependent hydrolase